MGLLTSLDRILWCRDLGLRGDVYCPNLKALGPSKSRVPGHGRRHESQRFVDDAVQVR